MHRVYQHQNKLCSMDELLEYAKQIRASEGSIVFTNGCFDIVHKGHVQYLRTSRLMGDCLVIGLNSDQSVRKLKGESRPVNTSVDRAILLEAFDFVDRIVIFNEDTPLNIIKKLKPEIYTKGGDYDMSNVIGKGLGKEIVETYGGKVELISSTIGVSSTDLIRKIGS